MFLNRNFIKRIRYRLFVYFGISLISVSCSLFWQQKPEVNQAKSIEKVVETRVSFLAVGDIMLSRGVARAISRSGETTSPFEKKQDVFQSTDFNFGNLESPISGKNDVLGKGLVFNADTENIAGLKKFNFKILNLANNHAFDQGLSGLFRTHEFLKEEKLGFIGTGENLEAAWQPKIIVVNGVRIGFVGASYSSFNDGGTQRNENVARIEDTEKLKRAIKILQIKKVDFIVATMHAGDEYTRHPNASQINFARTAIDFGADIVIGGHPHWIQTMEKYKDKYIFYSLGNFIFDQTFSRDTTEGLTLKITLKNRKSSVSQTQIEQIELLPVIIENASTPRLANEREAAQILQKIGLNERILK